MNKTELFVRIYGIFVKPVRELLRALNPKIHQWMIVAFPHPFVTSVNDVDSSSSPNKETLPPLSSNPLTPLTIAMSS